MNKKVPNEKEIQKHINQENSVITADIKQDLKRLTDLDFSILREAAIDREQRELYSYLQVYQEIVIHNIYQRSMDVIENEKDKYDLEIRNNNDGITGIQLLGITPKKQFFNIFYYLYGVDCKQHIQLYEYIENLTRREKEMKRIMDDLENLNKIVRENPMLTTAEDYLKKIDILEKRYLELAERKEMPEEDKYISEVQNHFSRLFEKEYGINRKKDYTDISEKTWDRSYRNGLHKVQEIKYPTLTLKKDIIYY